MNRVGVFGANGRMGLALVEAATINKNSQLAAAYVRSQSPLLDLPVNQLNSAAAKEIKFSSEQQVDNVDVLIDFTLPEGMRSHLKTAVAQKTPMVIGTTGLTHDDMALLTDAAKHIPIVFALSVSLQRAEKCLWSKSLVLRSRYTPVISQRLSIEIGISRSQFFG